MQLIRLLERCRHCIVFATTVSAGKLSLAALPCGGSRTETEHAKRASFGAVSVPVCFAVADNVCRMSQRALALRIASSHVQYRASSAVKWRSHMLSPAGSLACCAPA